MAKRRRRRNLSSLRMREAWEVVRALHLELPKEEEPRIARFGLDTLSQCLQNVVARTIASEPDSDWETRLYLLDEKREMIRGAEGAQFNSPSVAQILIGMTKDDRLKIRYIVFHRWGCQGANIFADAEDATTEGFEFNEVTVCFVEFAEANVLLRSAVDHARAMVREAEAAGFVAD